MYTATVTNTYGGEIGKDNVAEWFTDKLKEVVMKRMGCVFFLLCCVLLLLACGGNWSNPAIAESYSYEHVYDDIITASPIPHEEKDESMPTVQESIISENVIATESWQNAYATLLRSYAILPPPHNERSLSRSFILYDINKDAIPELIITYIAAGIWGESIYTFVNGEVVPLEFRDGFFAYYCVYAPQYDHAGIIIVAYGLVTLMQIDETGMFAELRLQSPFMPYDDRRWYINDIEVTEGEHDAMLKSIIPYWPQMNDARRLWPHELTEENIEYVIFQTPLLSFYILDLDMDLINNARIDTRIPSDVISLVIRHFQSIENGDLVTFRTALGAHDAQDVYRNMAIISRFFGDVLGIYSTAVSDAISTGENFPKVYNLLFESEVSLRSRNLGLSISEIRLYPYLGDGVLEVVVECNYSAETIYQIHFGYWDNEWAIGITNSAGWLAG